MMAEIALAAQETPTISVVPDDSGHPGGGVRHAAVDSPRGCAPPRL